MGLCKNTGYHLHWYILTERCVRERVQSSICGGYNSIVSGISPIGCSQWVFPALW
jgi:hypothetical protein